MLNGIAPIIIFSFKKKIDRVVTLDYPLIPKAASYFLFPPIPIYLDEKLTGIYIEKEQKNIDLQTRNETLLTGKEVDTTQVGINSTVQIEMLASRNSVGLSILIALCDQIFQKCTSKEYSITYISGAMTVFNGLLEDFTVQQSSDNDLYNMTLKLTKGNSKSTKQTNDTITVPLSGLPIT